MNRPLAALACAVALTAAGAARAQTAPTYYTPGYVAPEPSRPPKEPKSDGLKLITAGIILVGAGTLDVFTSPVCTTDFVRRDLHKACLGTTLGIGSTALVVGIPLLIVGVGDRRKFNAWHARYDTAFGFSAGKDHGVLSFRASF